MTREIFMFLLLLLIGSLYLIFYGFALNAYIKHYQNLDAVDSCEPVYIGIVCLKDTFNITDLYMTLKAIYFYRKSPISLHILVDDVSEVTIRTLFETWETPQVYVSIYNLNILPRKTFPKLAFSLLVPESVFNLLVIKPNLFCIGDIGILWRYRDELSKKIQILTNKNWASSVWLINVNNELLEIEHREYKYVDVTSIQCNFHLNVTVDFNVVNCDNNTTKVVPKITVPKCAQVPEINFKYRTLLFATTYNYQPTEADVTVVTQMSLDKFPVFEMMCERWLGPISVALYVAEEELLLALSVINRVKNRQNVAFHIVFKEGNYQPINKLRNVALKNVNTPFVLLIDVDFVPGIYLYEDIKKYIKSIDTMKKKALVIPAFFGINVIPTQLNHVKELWNQSKIIPFQQDTFPKGHGPTNYVKWKDAKEPYTIKWAPNYEPYVVVESSVPLYDERFVGYVWNKIQHILELDAANYEFIVLPDTFLFHKHHERSVDFNRTRNSKYYYRCMVELKKIFIKQLNQKYNRSYVYKDFVI